MQALEWLNEQEATFIRQLEAWCEINSGSHHPEGLARMKEALTAAFLPLVDLQTTLGQSLYFQKRPDLKRRILLCGHLDTVYPETSPFQHVSRRKSQLMLGPGVADMKGGLVVMWAALQAFEQTEYAQTLGWDVLINTDEEIGSRGSAPYLDALAQTHQAALIFEPAMNEKGDLARARKGSGNLILQASGKSAHAGRAFDEGRNAIILLAKALIQIDLLNGQRHGLTINTGLIEGGEALNQVPNRAQAQLDIRFTNPQDLPWIEQKVHEVCQALNQPPDLMLTPKFQYNRPVKVVTPELERLFLKLQQAGKHLNLNIQWQDSGGCCDGNNLSALGMPVLDTLGVRGGMIHTHQEFVHLDSIVERAALTTLLLNDLAQDGLEVLFL